MIGGLVTRTTLVMRGRARGAKLVRRTVITMVGTDYTALCSLNQWRSGSRTGSARLSLGCVVCRARVLPLGRQIVSSLRPRQGSVASLPFRALFSHARARASQQASGKRRRLAWWRLLIGSRRACLFLRDGGSSSISVTSRPSGGHDGRFEGVSTCLSTCVVHAYLPTCVAIHCWPDQHPIKAGEAGCGRVQLPQPEYNDPRESVGTEPPAACTGLHPWRGVHCWCQ